MNGFLGSYNLIDNLAQSVAQCTTDRYASATLNLCNRSDTETCYVDIAVTTIQSNFNATSRYIEFNSIIGPNTSLQRNGILISAGEFLTVIYRGQDPRCLSANTWAVQSGDDTGVGPIILVVPGPPVIITTSLPDADQDIAYSQQIIATSSREIVDYSIVAGALPTGLSLNNTTGIISGIPSGVDQTFAFTVRVTDSVDGTAEQEFTITKLPNSTPPIWITQSPLTATKVNEPYSLQLEVDEIGVVTYALVSGTLPTGLSLSSSGLISGTPTVEETASFVVSAINASGVSANQSFTIEIIDALYEFTTATFTTSGLSGKTGPSLSQARDGLAGPETETWKTNTEFFNTTNGIQLWTVPADGTYRIEAWGAQGADGGSGATGTGGFGARMRGDIPLSQGQVISIVVGQRGITQTNGWGGGGGGGGSFAWVTGQTSNPLIVAGGGGCGGIGTQAQSGGQVGTSGSAGQNNGGAGGTGGAASFSDGICGGGGGQGWTGGPSYHCGGPFTWVATYTNPTGHDTGQGGNGGFGGAGGSWGGGGGGGGYSGGGSGGWSNSGRGGGGGSFNTGTNQSNTGDTRTGAGQVQITLL